MALSRELALRIRNFLDNWLPPVMRDSRLLMYPPLRFAFGKRFRIFADFKTRGFSMSPAEFADVYSSTTGLQQIQGCTDLNDACVKAIVMNVVGESVLDAGCGRGYLADRLTTVSPDVVGCDIVLGEELTNREGLRFVEGTVERLPFDDDAFDTVVSTHTLEHVQRIDLALSELRRVTRRRLIVVVPRERPYRYSFNLHLHFFPYPWNWQAIAGVPEGSRLSDVGGDWFYVEEIAA
jgi:SAM-dependent methyltransferase